MRERKRETVREGRQGERETAESTTEKDGERKSDGEERRRSLVALSTRAPPSSTSAPKTPTLAAARSGEGVVENAREIESERYDKRGGNWKEGVRCEW